MIADRGTGTLSSSAKAFAFVGVLAVSLALAPAPAHAQWESKQLASAVKSSVGSDRRLRDFYRARGYRPLWIRGGTLGPEADQLVQLLRTAYLDGLDPDEYNPDEVAETIEEGRFGDPKDLARAERRLSRALGEYVQDIHRPADVGIVYIDEEMRPSPPSVEATLAAAAQAPSLAAYLDGARNPLYGGLRDGLARYDARWASLPDIAVPSGPVLKPGASGERVEMLRQRLGLFPGGGYDKAVATAVREFQSSHGMSVDGIAGGETIAALNRGPDHYRRLLRINLERARALPADLGERFVHVDAAAQRLWLYENGRVVDSMKVIVGKPTEQTPMMAGYMRFLALNPYWNIPPDLARKRIATKALKSGPQSLRGEYEVLSGWTDEARVLDPKTVNWNAVAAGREEIRVRQLPGDDNAMGDMKFMFPNRQGIYLHDTPDKHLFNQSTRMESSGCVRVEDARRLSGWLFGDSRPRSNGKPEQRVNLPRPVPVYITYFTAAADGGNVVFRDDAYNRDPALIARLTGGSEFASAR